MKKNIDSLLKMTSFIACVVFTTLSVNLIINPMEDLVRSAFTLFFALITAGIMYLVASQPIPKPKQDLLSILKTNGTGILEGTCRSKNGTDFMENIVSENAPDLIDVNFSLGSQYLGCYSFDCDGFDDPDQYDGLYVAYGPLRTEDSKFAVFLSIYFDEYMRVSRFVARLDS